MGIQAKCDLESPPTPPGGAGRGSRGGLQDLGNLWRPGPLGVKGCPGWAKSPGSRFLCFGPGTQSVRIKGASFCFKALAATPPHRNISAPLLPTSSPFFSHTLRTAGQILGEPSPLTRTRRRLLLPAPGVHWTARPPGKSRGRGGAASGRLRRRQPSAMSADWSAWEDGPAHAPSGPTLREVLASFSGWPLCFGGSAGLTDYP